MRPLKLLLTLAFIATASLRAENLPSTHPTVNLVNKYFTLVVEQNWKEAASMIRPVSIERKKRETLAIIKSAPTMSEEAMMLSKLGVKDIAELEKMSPADFYVADRESFHSASNTPEVQKQKKASLKIDVLGVVGEQNNTIAHLVVRTSQEVMDQRINELFFISFVQDETDATKWLIAPDMQRPVTEPLSGAPDAKKDAPAAPAPAPAAAAAAPAPAPAAAAPTPAPTEPAKPQAKAEPKPEAKPEPKAETKEEPAAETKPRSKLSRIFGKK